MFGDTGGVTVTSVLVTAVAGEPLVIVVAQGSTTATAGRLVVPMNRAAEIAAVMNFLDFDNIFTKCPYAVLFALSQV
jgi:hypothetical protein